MGLQRKIAKIVNKLPRGSTVALRAEIGKHAPWDAYAVVYSRKTYHQITTENCETPNEALKQLEKKIFADGIAALKEEHE